MDRAVVAAEESQWKSDSGASASKSLGSLVKIDTIAIEISGAMEEFESPVHEHFSIRGYVADMRKNDWRSCSPFTFEGGNNGGVCNLPPLSIPTFQWWRCSKCVPDLPLETRKEVVTAGNVSPVFNSGSVKHRGHKASTSKKAKKDMRDKGAVNRCHDMQEASSLQIGERPDTADASAIVRVAQPPRTGVERDIVSSGSDYASEALPCKRKPKLRSLADIMVEEKKSSSDNPKTGSVSSSGVQETSTETEPLLSPHLESDVPIDLAKPSRSPQRKRKNALEEDRGFLRTVHPSGPEKKLKGLVVDVDRPCKRLIISDQESGDVDASKKLNSLVAAKAHLMKPRKAKAPVSRKSRQSQIEDGMVLARELQKENSSCTENLEANVVSAQTDVSKIINGLKSVEETGQIPRCFLSGNQKEAISTLPNSEWPGVEGDRGHLTPPFNSTSEDHNAKGKVALDLSLNSFIDVESDSDDQESSGTRRFIPDLNEEFPIKAPVAQGKQLPSPMHKTTAGSVSCCNEEPIDLERQPEVSNTQNKENGKKIVSPSDDIPMEIVELLAKNQHERALGISKKHLEPKETKSCTRGYPPLTGSRNTSCFPFANRRSGVNMPKGILGIPVNFSQLNSCSRDATKPQESQLRLFNSSFTPSEQRKMQFLGSSNNSAFAGPNISGRSELYWPPRRGKEPFAVDLNQNQSLQLNSSGMPLPLFGDKYGGRGKTVNGIKDIERKHEEISIKKGRIGSSKKSVGSLDPYSNDTIPAMQLLSLMDLGISSGSSSYKASPKNFLEKPLSQCNHHPRVNGINEWKDLPKFGNGVFVTGESSKKAASSHSQVEGPSELGNSTAMIQTTARSNPPPLVVCTLNQNPADFSVPDARNKYTITARDLKPRNRFNRKQKPPTVAEGGRKRRRAKNDASSGKFKTAPENN